MKWILFGAIVLVVLPICDMPAHAQQTPAERRVFEQTKAQAEKGDIEAQIALAQFYTEGNVVERDLVKAAKWHRKAAERGSAKGQLLLGEDFANGVGVKLDKVEAIKWIRRAAEGGLAEAQFDLGLCYANGEGVKENALEAVKLFRQASEQNFVAAQYELGKCYLEGNGIAKNTVEGLKLVRESAEKGFGAAQNSLGLFYAKGEGVSKDNLEAYKWFVLAAAQEGEHIGDIKVNLAKVERFLTPDQISEAQRLASEFQTRTQQGPAASTEKVDKTTDSVVGGDKELRPLSSTNELKYGWLKLQAEGIRSEIYVDGDFVGNPPAKLKLSEGSHTIEVKSGGTQIYNRKIMITEGCELNLSLQ